MIQNQWKLTKEYVVIAYMFKLAVWDFEIITMNMKIAWKKKLTNNFNRGKKKLLKKKFKVWKYNTWNNKPNGYLMFDLMCVCIHKKKDEYVVPFEDIKVRNPPNWAGLSAHKCSMLSKSPKD